jgi:phosphoenolpyruvate synthase/pyruvate phosphate dikinase
MASNPEMGMNIQKIALESGKGNLVTDLLLRGECPTMYKAASGRLEVLSDFQEANNYLETHDLSTSQILVTNEIDWSWTRILQRFDGVITNKGTRVSRAAEVLVIMGKPGVLGTRNATKILRSGMEARIVCNGNEAFVCLTENQGQA